MKEARTCRQKPLLHLIKECDKIGRERRERINQVDSNASIEWFRHHGIENKEM